MLNLSSVEVALAVERPVDLHPEGFLSQNDGMPGDPPRSRGFGAHNDEVLQELRGSREPGTQVGELPVRGVLPLHCGAVPSLHQRRRRGPSGPAAGQLWALAVTP